MALIRSLPSNSLAARFGSSTLPCTSSPITPADTPASTVSVNRRRSSIWLYASINSPRCELSCPVMRLNARLSPATSSSLAVSGTRTVRSPPRTRSAARINPPIGRAIWLASTRPINTAAISTSSAMSAKIIANVICSLVRLSSSRLYSATACSVRTMWLRISGSTGRPISSISGKVEPSCTTARTRFSSGDPSTATSPFLA